MVEKPTEVNKDIHQFIHRFTKHSRRIDSMPQRGTLRNCGVEGRKLTRVQAGEPGLCHGGSASLLHCLAFLGDVLLPWASSLNVLNSHHESGPILRHYVNNFISFLL